MRRIIVSLLSVLVLVCAAACGDDDSDGASSSAGGSGDGAGAGEADAPEDTTVDDTGGSAVGGGATGTAVAVVGDERFEFVVEVCTFSPEEAANDAVLFGLNGVGDGGTSIDVVRQMGFAGTGTERDHDADPFDSIDIVAGSFMDPDLWWSSFSIEPVLEFDGRQVRADVDWMDETGDGGFDTVAGTFEATCP
ncbi:MAG: hypothetical protein ACXIVQ_02255 [Acidimicrobiales bacterium]